MKTYKKRYYILFLVFLLLFSFVPLQQAKAEQKTVVRVGFPEAPGMSETDETGKRSGFTYEWLKEIAKYTGWEYEYVEGSVEELVDGMLKGEFDLIGGMFYIESATEELLYPDYSMGSIPSLLIAKQDNDKLQRFDINTLNGAAIGVLSRATDKIRRLNNFLEFNNIHCELKYYKEDFEYERSLERGEVDIILGSELNLKEEYKVLASFEGMPFYFTLSKSRSELYEPLNQAIRQIYMANPEFAEELYYKYFTSFYQASIVLTEEEQEYIQQKKPLKVALLKDRYPLNYIREGEYQGINRDLFELISQRTGLNFEFVYGENYQETIDMVTNGKADILGVFFDDEYKAEEFNLVLTKAYVNMDDVILKNKKSTYPSEGLTVAVVAGKAVSENMDAGKILNYPNFSDCVLAVENGEADVTMLPSSFVEDLFYKNYYTNLTIVAATYEENQISIGLPEPVNSILYSILSKAVNNIKSEEMESIVTKNLMSLGESRFTLRSIIYSQPIIFFAVFSLFISFIALMLVLALRAQMKNRVMRIKLEKAEEASRVKTDFLSQMSHEIRTPMNAIIGLTSLARMSGEATPAIDDKLIKIDNSAQFLLALVNDILDMSKIESSKMKLVSEPFQLDTLARQLQSMFQSQAQEKQIQMQFLLNTKEDTLAGDSIRLKQVLTNLLSNALKFTPSGGKIIVEMRELQKDEETVKILFRVQDSGIGIPKEDLKRIFQSFEQAGGSRQNVQGTGLGLSISSHLVRMMGGELCVESEPGEGAEFYFELELPRTNESAGSEEILPEKDSLSLKGFHILLAEDNDLNAEIAASLLEGKEGIVERAVNGSEAVRMFVEHPEFYYKIILMDIQMPVKNGLEAALEIRKINRNDATQVPIVAMTANTFQEDRKNAMDAGMNAFIPKPFQVEQMYQILEKLIAQENSSEGVN